MNRITIVSIMYKEPEWLDTKKCIVETGLPVIYIDRDPIGVGSLSEAINRGVRTAPLSKYLFIVTNCTFSVDMPERLIEALDSQTKIVAVSPCFDSDHQHMKQANYAIPVQEVPFIEFTAVMTNHQTMIDFPLDEDMKYVGQDMDFGVRIRRAGFSVAVDHREKLGHTYLRHKKDRNAYTEKRKKLRKQAQAMTVAKLRMKYGMEYKDVIKYHGAL